MINKLVLQSAISKYYLGENESVKWVINNNTLTIDFMSLTKEVIGKIVCTDFKLQDSELIIFDTKKLLSLLNITYGDLLLELEQTKNIYTKLHISDLKFNLTYALADPLLISKVGSVTEPEWDVILNLEKEDVDSLIKAKNALSDVDNMVVSTELDPNDIPICKFTFGDEHGHNNKVTYQLEGDVKLNGIKLPFNSNTLKNILSNNKDLNKGTLYLNNKGLMKLHFISDNIESTYYVIRKEQNVF